MTDNKDPSPVRFFTYAAIIIVVIAVLFFLAVYLLTSGPEIRGQFGDTFGALNTIFSGFAFAGVIYAILLQRKELSLQRRELELTRQELIVQSQALSEQAKILKEDYDRENKKDDVDAAPKFSVKRNSFLGDNEVEINNTGGAVRDVIIKGYGKYFEIFATGGREIFSHKRKIPYSPLSVPIVFLYTNKHGRKKTVTLRISDTPDGLLKCIQSTEEDAPPTKQNPS